MTETARRLRVLGRPHARARALAVGLMSVGGALALSALGIGLAPSAAGVVAVWVAILGLVAGAGWAIRRLKGGLAPLALGRVVERAVGARTGTVTALAAPLAAGTSAALFAVADGRAADVVEQGVPSVGAALARETRRHLGAAATLAAVGAALLLIADPGSGRASAFWHPVRTLRDARAPVRLEVDRAVVRRGESVQATVTVPGATRATLWTRGPGEPWRAVTLGLDSLGRAVRTIGPLKADLFLRASSGGRASPERRVSVALPAFIADLALTARYPAHVDRPDEPLLPGPDTIPLPAGTEIVARGLATAALAEAGWVLGTGSESARLRVRGSRFEGAFVPRTGGVWRLDLALADGGSIDGQAPELRLRLVADSAPVVTVPVPGRDTVLPLSLRQPLVIDARDDHGLTRLRIVSWRVSRTGRVDPAVEQPVPLGGEESAEATVAGGAGDRAIVPTELALEERGLVPGDTVRLRVEAWDNAPVPQVGRSPEFALRLPTMEELRAATRAATREVAAAAESLAAEQAALGDRTRDLAQERSRETAGGARGERPAPRGAEGPRGGGQRTLPFTATERAEEVARRQAELKERVSELAEAVEEIARAARAAGIDDTAFQARLAEVRDLLERALTPELEERLRALQDALARLDPEATRAALQRLAEAQQQLREELERSRELFRRAAVEGSLASLAADAEDLARRQNDWNREAAARADSSAAAAERELEGLTDSLARGIAEAGQEAGRSLESQEAAARRAQEAMRRAAEQAQAGRASGARAAGQEATDALENLPEALRAQRDSLAREWRQEALAALDRALAETAALAGRQQEVAEALRRGAVGGATRRAQAAVEEGTEAIERQVREAAGRHALVSPQLQSALGFAQRQMRGAREQLEQADPNAAAAAALAEEALDALNATAHALARSRSAVAGAKSGSGFQEAVEQLARLAEQQRGLAADAQGMMPLLAPGGQALLEQLRALGARQRALAEQLERLRAEGSASAAAALAQEARELARQLEAGRLDPRTIERQERLYRRLLDAGRTLSGPEPDEQKERTSRPARSDSVRRPGPLAPGAIGSGPRVRYPTWDELRALTPEERRLVLEYFRRLNAPR